MTSEVVFSVEWSEAPSLLGRLAIDVLDARLTRYKSTLLGEPLDLEEGVYVARGILPDGQRVETAFEVPTSGEPLDVLLAPAGTSTEPMPLDAPDSLGARLVQLEFGDVAQFSKSLAQSVARNLQSRNPASATPASAQAWVRTLTAEVFDRLSPVGPSSLYSVGDNFEVVAGPKALFLQVRPPIWRICLPLRPVVADQSSDKISVRMVMKGGAAFPHLVFDNQDLELLLRYFGAGEIEAATEIASSHALVAERAFLDETERPFSAAAGAYVLLRSPNLERLTWTDQFIVRYPWLPDAQAIHGEWLARLGRHDEALTHFLDIPRRGIPFFSMGMATASKRLLQYAASEKVARPDNFRTILDQFDRLAKRVDYARPITTFKP